MDDDLDYDPILCDYCSRVLLRVLVDTHGHTCCSKCYDQHKVEQEA